jgi:FkbM family methyltransferase
LGRAKEMLRAGKRFLVRTTRGGGLRRYAVAGDLAGATLLLPAGWDAWYAEGAYEPEVAAVLKRLVRPGDVCLDVGAHFGYFTVLLAALCAPDGRVYAFEASPDNARILRANVRVNRLRGRVAVEQAAVGRSEGVVQLHAPPSAGSTQWTTDAEFAYRTGGSPPQAPLSVRSLRLGRFLAELDRADLIKMDIEGAEAAVLPTLDAQLERLRPTIVLEFHREVGWPAIRALLSAGYSLEALDGSPLPRPRSAADVPYQLVATPPHQ